MRDGHDLDGMAPSRHRVAQGLDLVLGSAPDERYLDGRDDDSHRSVTEDGTLDRGPRRQGAVSERIGLVLTIIPGDG
jgi:hypothetical protein